MNTDYLIVGSGLSALSFGALMAKAGKKVKILEAHDTAGGYGHTFVEAQKYRFNAQFHYVWNCGQGQPVYQFLQKLGMHEQVTFEEYDRQGYDHMRIPGYSLDIPCGYAELSERLFHLFPKHKIAIEKFVKEVELIAKILRQIPSPLTIPALLGNLGNFAALYKYRKATLQNVFDHFGLPLEAQTLVALQWLDFLLPPNKLAFIFWVLLFDGYNRGAYYPTHHFEHVIESLVGVIKNHGGEVLTNRKVISFKLQQGAVQGVVAENLLQPQQQEEFTANTVICNMDPRRAAEMIGFEHFSSQVLKKLNYSYSPSNFMAYCVVQGLDLRQYGFGKWNVAHSELNDLNEGFRRMYDLGDYSKPSFAITTPSLITSDRQDCPEGREIIELLTVANYQRFLELKIKDEKAYRHKKEEVLDSMLGIIEAKYIPNIRQHLVFKMTGSPTTNERYCWSPMGNSYGSNLTPENLGLGRLDYRSSLKNFYFCNASSGYAGFAGTIWTGTTLYETLSGDTVFERTL